MSDLLELLLNVALEVLGAGLEEWAGWRFYVPLLSSIAIAGLMGWWMSAPGMLCGIVIGAGVVAGIVWEVMGAQSAKAACRAQRGRRGMAECKGQGGKRQGGFQI